MFDDPTKSFLSVDIDQKLDDFQTGIIRVPTTSYSKCCNTCRISLTDGTKKMFSVFHDFENTSIPFAPEQ